MRHVPIRSCIGCGRRAPQRDLLRVVRGAEGALQLDASRRGGGRGGYVHPEPRCWQRFAQRKGAVRSFRAAIDRPARQALVMALTARYGGK